MLTPQHHENGYFRDIGGFPGKPVITTVAEYDGSGEACIACTQLAGRYSEPESRKILREWIAFLKGNPGEFRALHFNSRVPQALFDAACCQRELVELRCKWGSYSELSGLRNLKKLRALYLGSCPGAADLSPVISLQKLAVLYLENFSSVRDFSPLAGLSWLEQLVLSGPILGDLTVEDLDFLTRMPALVSVWLPNVAVRRDYSDAERIALRETGIRGVFGQEWWKL